MRWPFGPPHLTLKPSKTKQKNNKKNKTKKQKQTNKKQNKEKKKKKKAKKKKKQQKYPQNSFSVISQVFPFFLLAFQNFLLLTPWPKKRAPKKHYKNRVSAFFFEKQMCVTKRPFLDQQKPKFINSNYLFFCLFSSLSTTKNLNIAETPI